MVFEMIENILGTTARTPKGYGEGSEPSAVGNCYDSRNIGSKANITNNYHNNKSTKPEPKANIANNYHNNKSTKPEPKANITNNYHNSGYYANASSSLAKYPQIRGNLGLQRTKPGNNDNPKTTEPWFNREGKGGKGS
jgi:hypothetical protein